MDETIYVEGSRPDIAGVFTRLTETISRFIDFKRSLASQETMAEMVACYVLATCFWMPSM